MIITIKGADFSAKNIGTLSTWTIFTSLGSGATYSGNRAVDKGSSLSATITIAEGYELGSAGVSVIMGTTDVTSSAATVNGNTITINIASVTGNVTIKVPTLNTSTGEEDGGDVVEPETPTNGQWLSVLLTGDENAHETLMNTTLTGSGGLTAGCDVIYTTANVQSLLEGKKIYKFASNGLGENTVTLYSNPYVGDNSSNTSQGRTEIGTVTSTEAQAKGTMIEYSVSNPSAIKDGETLSIGWVKTATGIVFADTNGAYNTPVYYLTNGNFKKRLANFCSFDLFIGD